MLVSPKHVWHIYSHRKFTNIVGEKLEIGSTCRYDLVASISDSQGSKADKIVIYVRQIPLIPSHTILSLSLSLFLSFFLY
jgi:hypothetical protein